MTSPAVRRRALGALGISLVAGAVALAPASARQGAAPEPIRFTVSASGDLLMHQPLLDRALANGGGRRYDFAPFFRKIRPYVAGVDLGLCHAETPMGPGRPSTYPRFKAPTALARSIRQSGWDACSTASNHSLDKGQRGINSTIKALDKRGIAHTGTFRSRRDRRRPTLLSVRGLKIGFVAYTDATNGLRSPHPWSLNEYRASDPRAGAKQILRDVRRADRAGADAIVVQVHWGDEYARKPNSSQIKVARRLTKSPRVTAVVGQGPHVVQPIRRMRGKFVVFSEGNLVSNQRPATGQPAASQDGLIALLDMRAIGDRVRVRRVRFVPTWVRPGDFTVLPARPGAGGHNAGELRRSYRRTRSVADGGKRIQPVRHGR